jgi:hypothetical protein
VRNKIVRTRAINVQYLGEDGDAGDVGEYFGDEGDICAGAKPAASDSVPEITELNTYKLCMKRTFNCKQISKEMSKICKDLLGESIILYYDQRRTWEGNISKILTARRGGAERWASR